MTLEQQLPRLLLLLEQPPLPLPPPLSPPPPKTTSDAGSDAASALSASPTPSQLLLPIPEASSSQGSSRCTSWLIPASSKIGEKRRLIIARVEWSSACDSSNGFSEQNGFDDDGEGGEGDEGNDDDGELFLLWQRLCVTCARWKTSPGLAMCAMAQRRAAEQVSESEIGKRRLRRLAVVEVEGVVEVVIFFFGACRLLFLVLCLNF